MSYTAIAGQRMAYDIDGTEVGIRGMNDASVYTMFGNGIGSWLGTTDKGNLNKSDRSLSWNVGDYNWGQAIWFFFPEKREITHMAFHWNGYTASPNNKVIQGSNNSTNGMDGIWETAVCTIPGANGNADHWRTNVFAVSFSGPMKVIRVGFQESSPQFGESNLCAVHIYGMKAAGETTDDIIFCDAEGNEISVLKDWGDRPEGTTAYGIFYLKNVSSKTANSVNIQLNHADFTISTDQADWKAVIDIASLSAGAISAPIYTKLTLGPPLLTLGPRAARAIITVASFT